MHDALLIGNYGKGTVRNYMMEMRLLFQFHHHKRVEDITPQDITQYIIFVKTVHGVGYAKCKSLAFSCGFFFKKVIQKPYTLPKTLFPRKEFKLPSVMSQEETCQLCSTITDVRQKAVISLLYGTGMRVGELTNLLWTDIDRANNRILIRQGKGNKDRYTLLSPTIIRNLEVYYRTYQTKPFVFGSLRLKGQPMHVRSFQTVINSAMAKAGFPSGKYTAHTLRHSFATHLLDNGCDMHTIQNLLGHADIRTTMVYLHLQQSKRDRIVSPIEYASNGQV